MVFVADILGLPLAWWLWATLWRGTTAFWVLTSADDAEVFLLGCPSCFASADGHNQWEALQHRTPYDEPLGGKASLGRRARLAVVSRVLSEGYAGLWSCAFSGSRPRPSSWLWAASTAFLVAVARVIV